MLFRILNLGFLGLPICDVFLAVTKVHSKHSFTTLFTRPQGTHKMPHIHWIKAHCLMNKAYMQSVEPDPGALAPKYKLRLRRKKQWKIAHSVVLWNGWGELKASAKTLLPSSKQSGEKEGIGEGAKNTFAQSKERASSQLPSYRDPTRSPINKLFLKIYENISIRFSGQLSEPDPLPPFPESNCMLGPCWYDTYWLTPPRLFTRMHTVGISKNVLPGWKSSIFFAKSASDERHRVFLHRVFFAPLCTPERKCRARF